MQHTKGILTGSLAVILLAAWMVVGSGCGKAAQTVTEKVTEKAIERSIAKDGGSADVKLDSKSGTMQMKGKDASGNDYEMKTGSDKDGFQFKQTGKDGSVTQMGTGAKLPADFPKDIPLPDGLQVQLVQSSPEKKEHVVQGTSSTAVDKLGAFFKEKTPAQGWKELTTMNAGDMQTFQYEKDERVLSVMLMKQDTTTTISIQTSLK